MMHTAASEGFILSEGKQTSAAPSDSSLSTRLFRSHERSLPSSYSSTPPSTDTRVISHMVKQQPGKSKANEITVETCRDNLIRVTNLKYELDKNLVTEWNQLSTLGCLDWLKGGEKKKTPPLCSDRSSFRRSATWNHVTFINNAHFKNNHNQPQDNILKDTEQILRPDAVIWCSH